MAKKKTLRRERFLGRMEQAVPWTELLAVLEPFYPQGRRGHPPVGLEQMLRVYFLQRWDGLVANGVPDTTTLLNFRHLLATNDLCQGLFEAINADLAAPSSTKNREKQRDPERPQTKQGGQWHFGLKAHLGADRASGLVHTVVATAANVADIAQAAELLHGQEPPDHAAADSIGVEKREEVPAADPADRIDWQIARKRGPSKVLAEGAEQELLKATEKAKAQVRAFVEHPCHVVKDLFRHRKTRSRGRAKNRHQLHVLFGLANLVLAARKLP